MKKSLCLFSILLLAIFSNFVLVQGQPGTTYDLQVTFKTNPIIVAPGTNGYIEVILKNIGNGTISNIDITASSWDSSVVQKQGNWDVYVGDLEGRDSTSVLYEFKIPSTASSGLYQVVFEIEYSPGIDIEQTAIVKVEDSTVLSVPSVTPNSLEIGEVTTLTFNVTNNGAMTIEDIVFTWEPPNNEILPLGSSNTLMISSIPADNSTEVSVDVMVDPFTEAGIYPLTTTLEFYDSTGTKQVYQSKLGIQVRGTTDFEIVFKDLSGGSTTLAVANIGGNTGSSVIVSIPKQPNYMITGATSVNLGNLDAGDYTTVSFQLVSLNNVTKPDLDKENSGSSVPPTPPKDGDDNKSTLIVEISYTDLFGVRQTLQKQVFINPLSSSLQSPEKPEAPEMSSGMLYIIVGVIGIIVIVLMIKYGKRKKK